ncbi:MAG: hypothetical protein NT144_09105 [Bacteroidia bacterium]|nr:hypothetical protein [Bacteroidia bacterium]
MAVRSYNVITTQRYNDITDLISYLHISKSNGSVTMGKILRIGVLRETCNPPDRRVPLSPAYSYLNDYLIPGIK